MEMLQDIWNYRGFILGSVKRDFQVRYQNSFLGIAWSVINPIALILIYTVIFSEVMKTRLPGIDSTYGYSIFLCSGLLTWNLFVEIINSCQTIFLDNANLIKKVNFPKICLPIIIILNSLLNFSIVFGVFTIFLIISGNFPGLPFFALFPLLLIQLFFSVGLGLILGILNVFFRDISQISGIVLQFWFWLTPIVYSRSILGDTALSFVDINPLSNLISAYQTVFTLGLWPVWSTLIQLCFLSITLCILAASFYVSRAGEILDEI
jgi:lipopolysaccharide transport system permease protein